MGSSRFVFLLTVLMLRTTSCLQAELLPTDLTAPQPPPKKQVAMRSTPSSATGEAFVQVQDQRDQPAERPTKRKARAKPKGDSRSKLQKKETDNEPASKRAAELSQANKAAAAAISSCFGKSLLARPSWQNAK
jgi:hypothetical protein